MPVLKDSIGSLPRENHILSDFLKDDKHNLVDRIRRRLHQNDGAGDWFQSPTDRDQSSAVLFAIADHGVNGTTNKGPCLILNKRSQQVRQPGDLCCPGGGVSKRDSLWARLLGLPASPLARWPHWPAWRRQRPGDARRFSRFFATALREGFEEMRLLPWGVDLLGPLPVQQLVVFQRHIFPFVVWVSRQRRFFPNWEVEKVLYLPLVDLLDRTNYARYRLRIDVAQGENEEGRIREMPCYLHRQGEERELLWGATYRIVETFLRTVFDFQPPDDDHLPWVEGVLDDRYLGKKSTSIGIER